MIGSRSASEGVFETSSSPSKVPIFLTFDGSLNSREARRSHVRPSRPRSPYWNDHLHGFHFYRRFARLNIRASTLSRGIAASGLVNTPKLFVLVARVAIFLPTPQWPYRHTRSRKVITVVHPLASHPDCSPLTGLYVTCMLKSLSVSLCA